MNDSIGMDGGPIVLVGNPAAKELKSFWYKVWCKLCGDLFQFYPPKKNLWSNLDGHLQGSKHCKIVKDAAGDGKSTATALST